jgi:hypothetical protein
MHFIEAFEQMKNGKLVEADGFVIGLHSPSKVSKLSKPYFYRVVKGGEAEVVVLSPVEIGLTYTVVEDASEYHKPAPNSIDAEGNVLHFGEKCDNCTEGLAKSKEAFAELFKSATKGGGKEVKMNDDDFNSFMTSIEGQGVKTGQA